MPDWVIWAVIAAALAAGEVLTLGFFLGLLALGAAVAAIAAAAGVSVELQVALFAVTAGGSLPVIPPVALRDLKKPTPPPGGTPPPLGAPAGGVGRARAHH